MKLKKSYIEIGLVFLLVILAFWLWTLPIQKNPMPFGEGDAAWMFGVGDYIARSDRTITELPEYIHMWYYRFFPDYPNQLHYPPPYHIDYAIMEVLGGGRIVPVYLFIAITCFLGVFSTYFLIRKLYGIVPGFLTAFALIFSLRDIMTYLWGQRPTLLAFVYIPLILYAYYKYLETVNSKHMPIYLYIFIFLFANQFFFHIQGALISVPALIIYTIFWFLKNKKIDFLKKETKTIIIAILLLLLLCGPFVYIYSRSPEIGASEAGDITKLFSWFKIGEYLGGYPEFWFSYSKIYSLFLIPFLFIGLLYLILKRENRDLLLLSWFIAVYIALHLDVLGIGDIARAARLLLGEAPLFYSLIAIGLWTFPGLVKIPKAYASYVKYGLAVIFVVVLLFSNVKTAYNTLDTAYQGVLRITPAQYEFALWAEENLPEDSALYVNGILTYPKRRFIHMLSHAYNFDKLEATIEFFKERGKDDFRMTHVYVDYSDLLAIGDANSINQLREWENTNLRNLTLVYDKNNIRVYSVEG